MMMSFDIISCPWFMTIYDGLHFMAIIMLVCSSIFGIKHISVFYFPCSFTPLNWHFTPSACVACFFFIVYPVSLAVVLRFIVSCAEAFGAVLN